MSIRRANASLFSCPGSAHRRRALRSVRAPECKLVPSSLRSSLRAQRSNPESFRDCFAALAMKCRQQGLRLRPRHLALEKAVDLGLVLEVPARKERGQGELGIDDQIAAAGVG